MNGVLKKGNTGVLRGKYMALREKQGILRGEYGVFKGNTGSSRETRGPQAWYIREGGVEGWGVYLNVLCSPGCASL